MTVRTVQQQLDLLEQRLAAVEVLAHAPQPVVGLNEFDTFKDETERRFDYAHERIDDIAYPQENA